MQVLSLIFRPHFRFWGPFLSTLPHSSYRHIVSHHHRSPKCRELSGTKVPRVIYLFFILWLETFACLLLLSDWRACSMLLWMPGQSAKRLTSHLALPFIAKRQSRQSAYFHAPSAALLKSSAYLVLVGRSLIWDLQPLGAILIRFAN